jgi:hypothetical protein
MSLIIFVIWIVFACAVGTAASRHYKRDGFGWGVLAILISPLAAWLLLLLLGTNPDRQQPQPQRGVNWKAIDWSTGEIVKPRPISMEPAYIEPMSKTAMWLWLSLAGLMLAGLIWLSIASATNLHTPQQHAIAPTNHDQQTEAEKFEAIKEAAAKNPPAPLINMDQRSDDFSHFLGQLNGNDTLGVESVLIPKYRACTQKASSTRSNAFCWLVAAEQECSESGDAKYAGNFGTVCKWLDDTRRQGK